MVRDADRRTKKFESKIDGDVSKIRTDNYKQHQVRNYKSGVSSQVEIENKVKTYMVENNLPIRHTNYYVLFIKKLLSKRCFNSLEEAKINYNKWKTRGLDCRYLKKIAKIFAHKKIVDETCECILDPDLCIPFYEGSENICHDLSGNNLDGIIGGNGWTTFSKIGYAIDFSLDTAHYVRIEHNPLLNLVGANWSLVWWDYGRIPFVPAGDFAVVLGKGSNDLDPAHGEYVILINQIDSLYYGWLSFSDGVAWNLYGVAEITGMENKWNHAVITYDGVTLTLYVNGVYAVSFNIAITGQITEQPLWLGGAGLPENLYQCNGICDELKLYKRCLTPGEVKLIYEGEK